MSARVFFPWACRSICLRACPPVWWLLCSLSSSSPRLPVCLSAGLLGQTKVDLLHASCGNHDTRACSWGRGRTFRHPRAHKRSYWNMCAKENGGRKFFLCEFGMLDMSIESLPAFCLSNSRSYSFLTPLFSCFYIEITVNQELAFSLATVPKHWASDLKSKRS